MKTTFQQRVIVLYGVVVFTVIGMNTYHSHPNTNKQAGNAPRFVALKK